MGKLASELGVRPYDDVMALRHPVDALACDRTRDDAGRRAGDVSDARGRHCGDRSLEPPSCEGWVFCTPTWKPLGVGVG